MSTRKPEESCVVVRRLGWPSALAEMRGPLIAFGLCFMFGAMMPLFVIFMPGGLHEFAFIGGLFNFMMAFFIGMSIVFAISYANKNVFNREKELLKQAEKRLHSGESVDLYGDLQKAIDGNLKFKRHAIAEFYSNQLMSLANEGKLPAKLNQWIRSCECWGSTPAYHKRADYWLIWLFETRGTLSMTAERLTFHSRKISVEIDLDDIRDVSILHHPRWLKPVPLPYIAVTFFHMGQQHSIYLTPSNYQTDTVFEIKTLVHEWFDAIQNGLSARREQIACGYEDRNGKPEELTELSA